MFQYERGELDLLSRQLLKKEQYLAECKLGSVYNINVFLLSVLKLHKIKAEFNVMPFKISCLAKTWRITLALSRQLEFRCMIVFTEESTQSDKYKIRSLTHLWCCRQHYFICFRPWKMIVVTDFDDLLHVISS